MRIWHQVLFAKGFGAAGFRLWSIQYGKKQVRQTVAKCINTYTLAEGEQLKFRVISLMPDGKLHYLSNEELTEFGVPEENQE